MLSGRAQKRIDERLRCKKSCTILERDLARVWPRDERDQLKREKEIHAFAAANGWLATILDPGIRSRSGKLTECCDSRYMVNRALTNILQP